MPISKSVTSRPPTSSLSVTTLSPIFENDNVSHPLSESMMLSMRLSMMISVRLLMMLLKEEEKEEEEEIDMAGSVDMFGGDDAEGVFDY